VEARGFTLGLPNPTWDLPPGNRGGTFWDPCKQEEAACLPPSRRPASEAELLSMALCRADSGADQASLVLTTPPSSLLPTRCSVETRSLKAFSTGGTGAFLCPQKSLGPSLGQPLQRVVSTGTRCLYTHVCACVYTHSCTCTGFPMPSTNLTWLSKVFSPSSQTMQLSWIPGSDRWFT
jgi:hypothetical protein